MIIVRRAWAFRVPIVRELVAPTGNTAVVHDESGIMMGGSNSSSKGLKDVEQRRKWKR